MTVKGQEIVKRIDERRTTLVMTRKAISEAIGLKSAQSITDWSNGSIPQADTALYIADALGVSIRWLLTGEDETGLTPNERNLINKFRNLSDQDRFEINVLVDAKLAAKKN